MDNNNEANLDYRKRIESVVKNFEDNEEKINEQHEAIHRQYQSQYKSIGLANDLLRFLYILEQQRKHDGIEKSKETREQLMDYLDINESNNDDDDDVYNDENANVEQEKEEEHQDEDRQPHQPIEPVIPPKPEPPPPVLPQPIYDPWTEIGYIRPDTLEEYKKLLSASQEYERRYSVIDPARKKQLIPCLKAILNKLRKDSYDVLERDLFEFLSGHERIMLNQRARITNEGERLLCLSILASLILAQLLGGDFDAIKAEVFLPLINHLSRNQQQPEFRIIFLERLHKKCPYTVPLFPIRQPQMNDRQYLEALGYIEKQDGSEVRLETESEFLNRMSGLIRLFCKLLENRCPPFDKDISFTWKWIADVLNLPPQRNFTSVLVRIFLDEAGGTMMKEIPKDFPKLIQTIRQKYLPRLEKETSDDQMIRLRLTLDKFLK